MPVVEVGRETMPLITDGDIAEQTVIEVLQDYIESLWTLKNLFRGMVRPPDPEGKESGNPIPHCAVFVLETGGFEPIGCIDGGAGDYLLRCNVQVRVRSCINDYLGGKRLAGQVMEALRKFPLKQMCMIIGSTPRESCPTFLGTDETGHYEWSMNLLLQIDQKQRKKEC